MHEDATKFECLAHYYSQVTTKAWRCKKFAEGLRFKVQRTIFLMAIIEFLAMVEKMKIVDVTPQSNHTRMRGIQRLYKYGIVQLRMT